MPHDKGCGMGNEGYFSVKLIFLTFEMTLRTFTFKEDYFAVISIVY